MWKSIGARSMGAAEFINIDFNGSSDLYGSPAAVH